MSRPVCVTRADGTPASAGPARFERAGSYQPRPSRRRVRSSGLQTAGHNAVTDRKRAYAPLTPIHEGAEGLLSSKGTGNMAAAVKNPNNDPAGIAWREF